MTGQPFLFIGSLMEESSQNVRTCLKEGFQNRPLNDGVLARDQFYEPTSRRPKEYF